MTYIILQFTWGIIQNILGLIIFIYIKIKEKPLIYSFHHALVVRWHHPSSMGLGMFIFLGHKESEVLVHEYGHTLQSILLGPLFLPLIGIPSFIWAMTYTEKRKGIGYYELYTEKWANSLGEKYLHLPAPKH